MSDTQQQFCLRWHNYQNSLLSSLPQLLDWDDLTDVTLYAGGCSIKAHRIVLSACSQYFKSIFKELQPMQHPVIVVPGAEFSDLSALVTFMYNGEVNIYQHQLPSLIALADTLHIKGLAQFTSGKYEDERRWGESGNETWGGTRSKRSRPSDNEETNGSIEKAIIPSPNKSMYVKKSRPRLRTASPTVTLQQQQPPQQAPLTEILPPLQHLSQPVLEAEDLTKKERPMSPTSAVLSAPNVKEETNGGNGSGGGGGGGALTGTGSGPSSGRSPSSSKLYATCIVCGKQLSNQYNLRVHMETHRNAHYACSSCSHVSRSRDALRKHVSYRHPATSSATNSSNLSTISSAASTPSVQPSQSSSTSSAPPDDTNIHQSNYF
uniref:Uncharacterized protein n=1 Tax=Triatoma infestans TaxID=30076 RepID=A0A023F2A3_TRIIF